MANQPDLKSQLDEIANANIYSTYQPEIEKQWKSIRQLASFLSAISAQDYLPPATNQQFNGKPTDNWGTKEWADYARGSTNRMYNIIVQLKNEPPDGNVRFTRQNDFNKISADFIQSWGFFTAIFQANQFGIKLTELSKDLDESKKLINQIVSIRDAAASAASEVGAGRHADAFHELAIKHEKRARHWLYATTALALLLVVVTACLTEWSLNMASVGQLSTYPQLANLLLGKLVLLSVLYFMLVFAAKSYRQNTHLAVVNRHRETALQTFQTFVEGSHDDQTKNAVLLETTRCIFSHVPTGIVNSDDSAQPTQIVEVLRALAPVAKS